MFIGGVCLFNGVARSVEVHFARSGGHLVYLIFFKKFLPKAPKPIILRPLYSACADLEAQGPESRSWMPPAAVLKSRTNSIDGNA